MNLLNFDLFIYLDLSVLYLYDLELEHWKKFIYLFICNNIIYL